MTVELSLYTGRRCEFVDITKKIQDTVAVQAGEKDGIVVLFVPHTTAGITVNENTDPNVINDVIRRLDTLVPWTDGYTHSEGNSAAHIKASLMGFSQMLPFERGRLLLGAWQGVYFCEFDGPRNRRVTITIL